MPPRRRTRNQSQNHNTASGLATNQSTTRRKNHSHETEVENPTTTQAGEIDSGGSSSFKKLNDPRIDKAGGGAASIAWDWEEEPSKRKGRTRGLVRASGSGNVSGAGTKSTTTRHRKKILSADGGFGTGKEGVDMEGGNEDEDETGESEDGDDHGEMRKTTAVIGGSRNRESKLLKLNKEKGKEREREVITIVDEDNDDENDEGTVVLDDRSRGNGDGDNGSDGQEDETMTIEETEEEEERGEEEEKEVWNSLTTAQKLQWSRKRNYERMGRRDQEEDKNRKRSRYLLKQSLSDTNASLPQHNSLSSANRSISTNSLFPQIGPSSSLSSASASFSSSSSSPMAGPSSSNMSIPAVNSVQVSLPFSDNFYPNLPRSISTSIPTSTTSSGGRLIYPDVATFIENNPNPSVPTPLPQPHPSIQQSIPFTQGNPFGRNYLFPSHSGSISGGGTSIATSVPPSSFDFGATGGFNFGGVSSGINLSTLTSAPPPGSNTQPGAGLFGADSPYGMSSVPTFEMGRSYGTPVAGGSSSRSSRISGSNVRSSQDLFSYGSPSTSRTLRSAKGKTRANLQALAEAEAAAAAAEIEEAEDAAILAKPREGAVSPPNSGSKRARVDKGKGKARAIGDEHAFPKVGLANLPPPLPAMILEHVLDDLDYRMAVEEEEESNEDEDEVDTDTEEEERKESGNIKKEKAKAGKGLKGKKSREVQEDNNGVIETSEAPTPVVPRRIPQVPTSGSNSSTAATSFRARLHAHLGHSAGALSQNGSLPSHGTNASLESMLNRFFASQNLQGGLFGNTATSQPSASASTTAIATPSALGSTSASASTSTSLPPTGQGWNPSTTGVQPSSSSSTQPPTSSNNNRATPFDISTLTRILATRARAAIVAANRIPGSNANNRNAVAGPSNHRAAQTGGSNGGVGIGEDSTIRWEFEHEEHAFPRASLPPKEGSREKERRRRLLTLCRVGKGMNQLAEEARRELYRCPRIGSRTQAHKLHLGLFQNPGLRKMVKKLDLDLDEMCYRADLSSKTGFYAHSEERGLCITTPHWPLWYLHQSLTFLLPLILSLPSLLSLSLRLPSHLPPSFILPTLCQGNIPLRHLRRFSLGLSDCAPHHSRFSSVHLPYIPPPTKTDRELYDMRRPLSHPRGLDQPYRHLPIFPPPELDTDHKRDKSRSLNDRNYPIALSRMSTSLCPTITPALTALHELIRILFSFQELEYVGVKGIMGSFTMGLDNNNSYPNQGAGLPLGSEIHLGGKDGPWGKNITQMVLCDIALGDGELVTLVGKLPLRRLVLWRSQLVSRAGLRDAIIGRINNNSTDGPSQLRHQLQELVVGPGYWGLPKDEAAKIAQASGYQGSMPGVVDNTNASKLPTAGITKFDDFTSPCRYPLDQVIHYLPDLRHFHFEGDLMSIEGGLANWKEWPTDHLDSLIVRKASGWTCKEVVKVMREWKILDVEDSAPVREEDEEGFEYLPSVAEGGGPWTPPARKNNKGKKKKEENVFFSNDLNTLAFRMGRISPPPSCKIKHFRILLPGEIRRTSDGMMNYVLEEDLEETGWSKEGCDEGRKVGRGRGCDFEAVVGERVDWDYVSWEEVGRERREEKERKEREKEREDSGEEMDEVLDGGGDGEEEMRESHSGPKKRRAGMLIRTRSG